MRISQTVLLIALAMGAVTTLSACGDRSDATVATAPRWNVSKPASAVGRVRAAVVERPAPDRVWIEAIWEAHDHGTNEAPTDCEIRIDVPEGAFILEGQERVPLSVDDGGGSYRWLVSFPVGRPLDAVLRYCAVTAQGPRAAEVAVRLTEDESAQEQRSR